MRVGDLELETFRSVWQAAHFSHLTGYARQNIKSLKVSHRCLTGHLLVSRCLSEIATVDEIYASAAPADQSGSGGGGHSGNSTIIGHPQSKQLSTKTKHIDQDGV